MGEAAYEIPLEDLHAHPERWDEAVGSAVHGKVITLTGRGERLAAVVPAEQIDLVERLQETIDVLSDTEAVQAIMESRRSITAGEGVRGVEAVRALLDQRQQM
ncbi:type II toxin-antitoxin system prevent-host-death family antitoxin [Planomonospora algeriensis]